jgi:type VI secretion system secreted protein VgrG
MRLESPWDHLIVTHLRGREGISELFQIELDVVWQQTTPMAPDSILLQSITLTLDSDGMKRYINGIVKEVVQGPQVKRGMILYTLLIVPKAWLGTRHATCRIFQNQTAMDTIMTVLRECGMTDLRNATNRTFTTREYCVQYDETNFAFASRLMEFEGVCYYFEHEQDKHTMVLLDENSSFKVLETHPTGERGAGKVLFEEWMSGLRESGRIHEWHRFAQVRTGNYRLDDYNFTTSSTDLSTRTNNTPPTLIYENPGGYETSAQGEALLKLRLEEENTPGVVVRAKSFNLDLCAGYKFSLDNHFADNGDYILTSLTHMAIQPLDSSEKDTSFNYNNDFTCIPFAVQYRPPRITPSPHVRGVQTAVVAGTSGEEIYTDKYGRVKVHFHWDITDNAGANENSSCWVRVASYWAGSNWGAFHIPRIGQEVVVDFVDGDVDRPLIVGSVYNDKQMPPYTLPDEKTKSTLKSNSSKGGGGYNEFRFEDLKGSEEVYFQAEKDHNTLIKHDETRKVKNDRTTTIEHDEAQTVTNNETIVVDQGNQSITLNMGNQTTELKQGNQSITIDMGNQTTELKMGNQSTKMDLGSSTHEAMQSITLKVGQNSIVIDQTGVTIKGLMVQTTGQIMVKTQAPMVQEQADAMLILKGGLTMIN